MIDTIRYEDGIMYLIDQTKLPTELVVIEIDNLQDTWDAIKELKVRGAPAIGVAAAYGVYISTKDVEAEDYNFFYTEFKKASDYLASSRPTAVNLFWALERMERVLQDNKNLPVDEIKARLEKEAILIHSEDTETCRKIGENGVAVLKDGMTVLTHCNAGRLAATKYGTALAPIYVAKEKGMNVSVYADETRPLLQGSRLTTFELMEAGVDVTLITDNMAAMVMSEGKIDVVIIGCDRVAANGDTANKIGTYGVALLAKAHNIPFYIAGPLSTIDLNIANASGIPIEEREPREIIHGFGDQTAPTDVKVYNPAFDVTPNELITGIITEKGIAKPPYDKSIKELFEL